MLTTNEARSLAHRIRNHYLRRDPILDEACRVIRQYADELDRLRDEKGDE